jgi:hypothetical protein
MVITRFQFNSTGLLRNPGSSKTIFNGNVIGSVKDRRQDLET